MQKKDNEQAAQRFGIIRDRQVTAIALAIVAVIVVVVASKRPDLFGEYSRKTVLLVLGGIILFFINFSSWNWRCPSCKRYLGSDIAQVCCRKCGARFQ